MQIKRVFDIEGPNGFVPNGWNWNYTYDMWDHNFTVNHHFIEKFNKKYIQVPVFDCNLNIPLDLRNIHISDIHINDKTNIISTHDGIFNNYFYTIHPYGSVDTCIGTNTNYHEGTHTFDFISEIAKKYIREVKNFYLIFDYSTEGDIRKSLFENLHKKCVELNLPPNKIIVISSSMNTRSIYNEFLKDNPQKTQFYTSYYAWSYVAKKKETEHLLKESVFEFNGHLNQCSLMNIDELKSTKNKPKKCLIYNRRVAPHRLIILSLLESDNLLEKCSYSIDLKLWEHDSIGLELANGTDYDDNSYIQNKEYKSKMINGFFRLNKIGKSVIDYDNVGSVWGFGFEHKEPYLNTYFSLITETLFYEHGRYISEKTFKGISHMHPFIVLGKPGILKQLKKWGFKTFSDFWDESYDEIENNSERMIKVYQVVKSLIDKSNEEWDLMYDNLIPILEYNRNHLLETTEEYILNTYTHNLYKLLENEPNQEDYSLL
jgi:hypothetical protein